MGQKKFLIFVVSGVLVLASLPQFLGYLFAGDRVYRGELIGPDMHYLSFVSQAREGKILFKNLYTSEDQKAVIFRPVFLITGWVSRVFDLEPWVATHLLRVLAAVGLVGVVYWFVGLFRVGRRRKLATLIILFGSGWGFFFSQVESKSVDLWMAEANTFATLFTQPHFIVSLMLMMAGIGWVKQGLTWKGLVGWRRVVAAGGAISMLILIHPFDLPAMGLVIGFLAVQFWREGRKTGSGIILIKKLAALSVLPILAVGYHLIATWLEPGMKAWQAQNILPSPLPWWYVTGFGTVLTMAMIGSWEMIRRGQKKMWPLMAWAGASLALVYAPVNFQRRMIEGAMIPLGILAAEGIWLVWQRLNRVTKVRVWQKRALKGSLAWMLGVTMLMTSLFFWVSLTAEQIEGAWPVNWSPDLAAVWEWLDSQDNKTVLALRGASYLIGGGAATRAYSGHEYQTIDFARKQSQTEWFFGPDPDNWSRQAFLWEQGIDLIFFGPQEREKGGFEPETASFLKKTAGEGPYEVYEVRLEGPYCGGR